MSSTVFCSRNWRRDSVSTWILRLPLMYSISTENLQRRTLRHRNRAYGSAAHNSFQRNVGYKCITQVLSERWGHIFWAGWTTAMYIHLVLSSSFLFAIECMTWTLEAQAHRPARSEKSWHSAGDHRRPSQPKRAALALELKWWAARQLPQ